MARTRTLETRRNKGRRPHGKHYKRRTWTMMKRPEIQLQQCLFYERDSIKWREKGMHYQNNTNQTPTNTHRQIRMIKCD